MVGASRKLQTVLLVAAATFGCTQQPRRQVGAAESETVRLANVEGGSSAPKFNVKLGCPLDGANVPALGDGITDDTTAIQNCLYAAGAYFASTCPARPWSQQAGYPDCAAAEVLFPSGKYFVQGVWESTLPGHSDAKNSGYLPQWVVFSLPRGVAVRGEGMNSTTITLNRVNDCRLSKDFDGNPTDSNTCVGERFQKRRGTYLFMAGFEKLPGYCAQPAAKLHNRLCSSNKEEIYSGGAQNSFEKIALEGDHDALVSHWLRFNNVQMMKSQSTAIHLYKGRALSMNQVKTNYWYRALNAREVNGVRVVSSQIFNFIKAGLFFVMPKQASEENYNWSDVPTSRLQTYVATNKLQNSPLFFEALEAKRIKAWGTLSGVYFNGNISSASCSDVTVVNNTLRYARIYYEQPCSNILIERNHIWRAGMPIQVGSFEYNSGLNIAGNISILKNDIHESLSGILLRGCDYNTDTERCAEPAARPVVRGNIIDSFLPLAGPGSDPWVTKLAR